MTSEATLTRLREGAADFRYLLNRGYPRRAALSLVGNRYGLDRTGRQLLHRGVFASDLAATRRRKIRLLQDLSGLPLGIDGHNVLITLIAALRGLPLVAADDGFIRDAALLSGTYRDSPETEAALALLADLLARTGVGPLSLWFDAPMSRSGELARRAAEVLHSRGLEAASQAVPVPERELLAFPGPIATSDTHLIDAGAAVADLAGEIIRAHPTLRANLIAPA
ncbi:MAG: DUF434 domain-containing protein [Deltaproteobacteria bacterium]|nr:DUF434 domain-containing protein [Deltaproteobacteria bacterium]